MSNAVNPYAITLYDFSKVINPCAATLYENGAILEETLSCYAIRVYDFAPSGSDADIVVNPYAIST